LLPQPDERFESTFAATEGERKHLTVLFADTKSSLALVAGLDPEVARSILDPVLTHMIEAVRECGGTVNQVMGDGIMALFGAPLADEQHAQRACMAALRMQAAVTRDGEARWPSGAPAPQIRVGINSGEVVVRSIGSDMGLDYTAVGEVTHVAARMEQLAAPGSVLITQDTLRLTKGSVLTVSHGLVHVAGLSDPVEALELVNVDASARRQPLGAGAGEFVGRDGPMQTLFAARDVVVGRHGQALGIVGDAGIGKTRLLREFVHSLEGSQWLVLWTGCVAVGRARGYQPIVEALTPYFGVAAEGDPREVRDAVAQRLLALDATLQNLLPALWALLDVLPADSPWRQLEPRRRRQSIIDAVSWIVVRESQIRPVLVVVEDLHWVDAETAAVLDAFVAALQNTRVLLLGSARPGANVFGGGQGLRTVFLEPLSRTSAEDLLDSLLGSASDLDVPRQELIERTGGNPFFIEECVSAFARKSVAAGSGSAPGPKSHVPNKIPASVQGLLASRIDRLAAEDKRLLQVAAVIGEAVPRIVLAAVVGRTVQSLEPAIARLCAADLLRGDARDNNSDCVFKHALIQEVAHESLLSTRRRELHARVVAAMEDVYVDSIEDRVDQLAHHCLGGGLGDKAARYLTSAGHQALERGALLEAITCFERALEVIETLPGSEGTCAAALALRKNLGAALRASPGDRTSDAQTHYERALEICDRCGQEVDKSQYILGLWACHFRAGGYSSARRLAVQAADGASRTTADEALQALWATTVAQGRPAEILAQLLQLDGERHPSMDSDGPCWCWWRMSAIAALCLGRFAQARAIAVRNLHSAEQSHDSTAAALAHFVAAVVYFYRGDAGPAMLHARAASDRGHMYDMPGLSEQASILVARLLLDAAGPRDALQMADANLEGALRGESWNAGMTAGLAADLYGRAERAEQGLAIFNGMGSGTLDGLFGPELRRLRATLLLACRPQDDDEVEAAMFQAMVIAREREMKAFELRIAISLSRLIAPRDRRLARATLAIADQFRGEPTVADLRTARALQAWLA
jgi:class 3 adenylate cyclase/tetratricopeptide (TPR) repeat protein